MKQFFKNFVLGTLPALLFMILLLELVFRFVIPATETPNYVYDPEYQMLKFEAHTEGHYTVGRFPRHEYHWSINNAGWNYPRNYTPMTSPGYRVAVIGDSYVESLMNDVDDMYPAVLDSLWGDTAEVMAFGISGAPLSQYLHMARYAREVYAPDLLIITMIHNDYDESLHGAYDNAHFMTLEPSGPKGKLAEVPPTPYETSGTRKWLKYSATARYLIKNLHITTLFASAEPKAEDTVASEAEFNANVAVNKVAGRKKEIIEAVDYIVNRFANEFPGTKILFVLDGPRHDIYSHNVDGSNVYFLNEIMTEACRTHQLPCLDLTSHQEKLYRANGKPFNSEEDFHWNTYGHYVVAEKINDYLSN